MGAQQGKSRKVPPGDSAEKVKKAKKSGKKTKQLGPASSTHLPSAPTLNNQKTMHSPNVASVYGPTLASGDVDEYRKDNDRTWHVNVFSANEKTPSKRMCNVIIPR